MAIYLDEAKHLNMYRGQFRYPIEKRDRLKGSLVYLMTPDINASINTLNLKATESNDMNFKAYFLEKNIEFIINNSLNENGELIVNEESVPFNLDAVESFALKKEADDIVMNEEALFSTNQDSRYRLFFPDFVESLLEEELFNEETMKTKYGNYNITTILRQMLYANRIKNQSEVLKIYDEIKRKVDGIQFTFVDPKLYKDMNLYYDFSFYTNIFFKSKQLPGDKGLDIFTAFINRFLNDNRFTSYTKRTIVIPVHEWVDQNENAFDHLRKITPISLIYRSFKTDLERLKNWDNTLLVFVTNNAFFTMDLQYINTSDINKFATLIKKLQQEDYSNSEEITTDSKLVIMNHLAHKFTSSGIEIKNLTGGTSTMTKDELDSSGYLEDPEASSDAEVRKAVLVNKLEKVAEKNTTAKNAVENLDAALDDEESDKMKDLLFDIQSDEGIKINKTRALRHDKMQQELLKKEVKGRTVKQLLDQFASNEDLPTISIPVESIDEHWSKLKFPAANSTYTKEDMDADIMAMFYHFTTVTHPMNILKVNVENTSTSEDYINTWTVEYEDAETGKRSTIKLDLPLMWGDRFMKLRGNEKVLIGQLMLLPIIKTDEDTVQIVSNYNKIFIRRKSPSGFGKSTPIINKIVKVFNKYGGKEFTVITGDNRKVCSRYALPASFIDMASLYSSIKFKDKSYISFNMDNLKEIPFDRNELSKNDAKLSEEALMKKYMAVYVRNGKKIPIIDQSLDEHILDVLSTQSKDFVELYNVTPVSKRLMFSEASILNMRIPVIIVVAYSIGLQKTLSQIGIKYEFQETRPKKGEDYIRFSDGYLKYEPRSDADNLLMNGLMQISTENYSIKEINTKDMWLSILDEYGGRIKADGLDNFYDLMMDPITQEICKTLHIPSDYIGALLYASSLLVDSKYNRHSDITGNRLRVNEVIVGHLYSVLAKEYGSYRNQMKRNRGSVAFSAKRSAVIDSILTHDQTSSDLSTLTPLLEAESATKVTFKGLSGLNSERAFSMEKRTYDDSMLGVLSLTTGFAGTVGINRQTTIDAGIKNKRGFIVPKDSKQLDNLSTFSAMEAMSPLAINRDDPIRSAMAFTQTVQHMMTVKRSMPNLITCGADEALPYLTSNKFSYKFKGKRGTVLECTDEYIVVQDDDTKQCDFIDLRETIQKNSDGGFYVTTKLDANKGIKKGSKLKFNDIVAYNKANYSPAIGNGNQKNPNSISYNIGTLSKIGILNTAMGFEDSTYTDSYLATALATDLVVCKDVNLAATANIYTMVKPGDPIEEGEPLLVFSDSFEDEDANALLRNISKDNPILSDVGRKQVHAKVSGKVQDIRIYRTVEMDELSPTLQEIVKKYEAKTNKLKKVMRSHHIDKEYELASTDKLPMEGKLKGTEGILIEFFIMTVDKFGAGDKLTFNQGLKGVSSGVIPKGKEAHSMYRKNEFVSAFLTATGVSARMVVSCLLCGYINKGLIELSRQCQEDMGIKWRPIQDIMTEGLEV